MEPKKTTIKDECFCKEHCKCTECAKHKHANDEFQQTVLDVEYFYVEPTPTNENSIDDTMAKGRILEAELHKELLDDHRQCSRENCPTCNSILC